ncbi:MAG: cytochrome c [Gammaproteobacteria bacterium]|nr:cytochrome c [Gammaproteobacteria bacterium]MBU1416358.1 cytochrome c [Gammaproteobacteria bacterium]
MRQLLFLLLAASLVTPALAAVDIEKGKRLHDKQCVGCHVERYGGDGSQIYLRTDRIIRDRAALDQRVATCNAMTNAGLLPEDEQNIAAYLAQHYYKFK